MDSFSFSRFGKGFGKAKLSIFRKTSKSVGGNVARRRVADNSRPARGVRDVAKVFFIMARSRAALILVKFTWQLEFTGHHPREIHLERGYALQ